ARLLDADVEPVEPAPPPVSFAPLRPAPSRASYDAAILSWMEAGQDYRAEVAALAPVVVNAYDVEGGCGVKGDVGFERFGYAEAASWRTPSFEDVAHAMDHRGLTRRRGYPGNRIDVLTRDATLLPRLRDAVATARGDAPLPWERELEALGL
ncbi:MAG TPA: hypothetical protein VM582_02975, partial [Candidatus Thermoplasmatota archaeon]|nr:hypothetical protein [Candidatus Thermoplasmatota archaeon]